MRRQNRLLFPLLISVLLLCLTACWGESGAEYFSYRRHPFRAEIQGELNGVRFTAEIGSASPDGQGDCYVSYLSPASLAGLTVKQESNGDLTATLGGITPDSPVVQSLILPVLVLLECDRPLTVQKIDGNIRVQTATDCYLTLSNSSIPASFSSPTLSFTVLWWETS